MEKLQELISNIIHDKNLTQAILSNARKNDPNHYTKVVIKPIEVRGEILYQLTYHYSKKVLHENMEASKLQEEMLQLFTEQFKQGLIHTTDSDFHVLISKKGKVTILKKQATKPQLDLAHNRKKNYILQEGEPIPFLIQLGVMNEAGKVLAKKYDKFKQINRFLEMVADVVPYLPENRELKIVDFGCGKSYLTFALYYYLQEIRGLTIKIIGLDLKQDVIEHCHSIAKQLSFDSLQFLVGDIAQYNELEQVDMVVTLHACDTATDAALEKAVRWGAHVILSVPCCQHELYQQVENEILSPMLQHGIVKERFASLATDSVRAQLLEILGYKTQLLEFIDMEHTPKNILIRAVKEVQDKKEEGQGEIPINKNEGQFPAINKEEMNIVQQYLQFRSFLQINPALERMLNDKLEPLLQVKQS